MTEEKWVPVAAVAGRPQAELLGGLLEAQGIQVFLSQEGAGFAYGLTIGVLGTVEILVPESQVDRAGEFLSDYYAALNDENETAALEETGDDAQDLEQS